MRKSREIAPSKRAPDLGVDHGDQLPNFRGAADGKKMFLGMPNSRVPMKMPRLLASEGKIKPAPQRGMARNERAATAPRCFVGEQVRLCWK
jgi:hypothetical protein